jgi:hypothetical protein
MMQFNLLPDVKKEYIKAKRTKHLILTVSTVASVAALFIVFTMYSVVNFAQKKNISDLTTDIDKEISSINSTPDLGKILTIQNQLNTVPILHEGKPQTSRLFDFLTQVTPADIKIQEIAFSITDTNMVISGTANSLTSINTFADTLKFATYNLGEEKGLTPFTSVITTLNRKEEVVTYEIEVVFDSVLFDNTQKITLVVPDQVTTRSTLGKPDLADNELFDDQPVEEEN